MQKKQIDSKRKRDIPGMYFMLFLLMNLNELS